MKEAPKRPARVVLLYADEDLALATQLERMFRVLETQGSIELWSQMKIEAGRPVAETIARRLDEADLVLPLLSADFVADDTEFKWLEYAFQMSSRRQSIIIPILLRPVLLPEFLSSLSPLPRNLVPITVWKNRDEALLDVIKGVEAIVQNRDFDLPMREAGDDKPPIHAPGSPPRTPGSPAPLTIHHIFRIDGPPDQTFVRPIQFDQIQRELGIFGRGLIVEGPSKVGKSTAVRVALQRQYPGLPLKEVDGKLLAPDDTDGQTLAEFESILAQLAAQSFSGHLVIDDFHYLDELHKKKLAKRMKGLADQARPNAKVTLIGINPIGDSLAQLVPDLSGRYSIIRMDRQPDEKLIELIIQGEQAARVRFQRRGEIINEADGSFYIAQLLCQRLLDKCNIREAQSQTADIPLSPAEVMEGIVRDFKGRYYTQILDFAAYDEKPPPRGAGLVLLWLLSQSKDGDIAIQEALLRWPNLKGALEWMRSSHLGRFFQTHPSAKNLLYYNRGAGTLSLEDPQLKFFLRKLDWEALAIASGHHDVQYHPADGPQFSLISSEEARDTSGVALIAGIPPQSEQSSPSVPPIHILHLSDIHISTEAQATLWYAQLSADLRGQRCEKLAALVVSGDITNQSTSSEYGAAQQLLQQIMNGFGLTPRQLILVPGNHDLNWLLSQDAYSLVKRARYRGSLEPGTFIEHTGDILEVRDDAAYKLRFKHFAAFYYEIKGEEYALSYEDQATYQVLPEYGLEFLGLNSAWEIDHHFRSRAGIHPTALARALIALGKPMGLRIAVFHHPVKSGVDDEIRDAGFLQQLAVAGFRIGLHGHIHKGDNLLYRYDMSAGGRRMDLVAGGTFGAATREMVPGYPLQYNLLRVMPGRVIVETRRKEEINGAWSPDARWLKGAGRDPEPRYEIEIGGGND